MEFIDLPFVHLLEAADFNAILDVRERVSSKYQRLKRIKHFTASLKAILDCVHHDRVNSWKRALVCGICECDNILAVNNCRLQRFSCRCKSSINGLFTEMGYRTVAINRFNQSYILAQIPFLATHNDELRQWTYRVMDSATPIIPLHCHSPTIANDFPCEFQIEQITEKSSKSSTEDPPTFDNTWMSFGESWLCSEETWTSSESFSMRM
jgi:hypothetical protein